MESEISAALLRRGDTILGVQLVIRDISVRKHLEKQLLTSLNMVKQTENAAILALAKLSEYRDITPGHHLERIREYCKALAIELARRCQFAKFVICRSGYTSMMELAELDKHHGLFIPTPGQPEQEYLSYYYKNAGWFYSKSQYKLNLVQDIPLAMKCKGFPSMPKTKENVERLYTELLAQYID